jgi:hypothetical protein
VAQHGEVLAGLRVAKSRLVLAEGDIKGPVQIVFDPLVIPHSPCEPRSISSDASDVEANQKAI